MSMRLDVGHFRNLANKTNRYSSSGFTLIELLVVISIISLLIAILLPALKSAREAAYAVQCLSNQRQIGVGMYNYAVDNKDHTPPHYYSPPGDLTIQSSSTVYGVGSGPGLLVSHPQNPVNMTQGSYLSTRETLFCPTQKVVSLIDDANYWTRALRGSSKGGRRNWIGYIWWYRINGGPVNVKTTFLNDLVTREPSNTVLHDFGPRYWAEDVPALDFVRSHESRVNVLYLGGHARAVPIDGINHLPPPPPSSFEDRFLNYLVQEGGG